KERVMLSPNQDQLVGQLRDAEQRSSQPFQLLTTDQQDKINHPGLNGGRLFVDRQDVVALEHEGLIVFSGGNGNKGGQFGLTSKARHSREPH
ncbi:MAG TPA: hypothetical protein VFI42_01935, partial [Thermomicrobiaceae bacterium]|nr:hypothetical protein [Thermomicrobiaceae bacterium]